VVILPPFFFFSIGRAMSKLVARIRGTMLTLFNSCRPGRSEYGTSIPTPRLFALLKALALVVDAGGPAQDF
jgi:hypothetical protein